MRTITVKIPRLPAVAEAPAAAEPVFGPLGWEWASEGDDGDEPTVFAPPLELVHIRAFNFAMATCPGAVSWRIDPEGYPFTLYQCAGACIVQGETSSGTTDLYAVDANGAELGPITIEEVA